MDLKCFAADDFNAKDWINKAWSATPSSDDKELFASGAVSKLQLYIKQLTNGLDETTAQIVGGVPRVLQEAAAVRRGGEELRERLLALERRVRGVEADTGHSIESLQRIDWLKSSLENAASALREADKWAQLADTLEERLKTGVPTQGEPLAELTRQVAAMAASLEVLEESPDYESKRVQLQVLYYRLEAALSPAVVEALTRRDAEAVAAYVGVFAAMRREPAAARYWRRVEAARLEAAWRRRQDAGAAHELLRDLHSELLAHAHSQMEWLVGVVRCRAPLAELVQLYAELLAALEPPPARLAAAALRRRPSAADRVDLLLDVRAAIAHFAGGLAALLDGEAETVRPELVRELARAAYAPLRELLPSYTELQAQALTAHLNTIDCAQEDALERARALQTCVERAATWAAAAHATARRLAGDACYPHLLPALEALLAELCSRLSANLRLLDAEAGAGGAGAHAALPPLLPAALALAAAAGELRALVASVAEDVLRHLRREVTEEVSPLEDLEATLLEPDGVEALARLRSPAADSAPLAAAADDAGRVCRSLAARVLQMVSEPLAGQLDRIPELGVWNDNDPIAADLPDFSIAPQEYITQVGQYLITLPQHLEPYLAERPAGLAAALAPHRPDVDLAVYLVNEVCSRTCEMYSDRVLSVRNMDALGAKRCATDIEYLCSVVEELGCAVPPALRTLQRSLQPTQ